MSTIFLKVYLAGERRKIIRLERLLTPAIKSPDVETKTRCTAGSGPLKRLQPRFPAITIHSTFSTIM